MNPELKRKKAMKPVTLRLEQDTYEKIKALANEKKLTESDVYRSAIDFFLSSYPTNRSK